jgi:hypothetical protein
VNGDIEALLRSGLAEQAERAPETVDDPALADLAIAGAHRIRRRRRIGAAAGAACLLAFGGGTFVLKPLLTPEDQAPSAADTTTVEVARSELGMEFVVEGDGAYHVINDSGDRVTLGDDRPQEVYRLEAGYLVTYGEKQAFSFTSLDGAEGTSTEWRSDLTRTQVNGAATEFALATPDDASTEETYEIFAPGDEEFKVTEFTTSYDLTLTDWSGTTAVFSADLWPTTAGQEKLWHFDEQYQWNVESVGLAGYESAVFVDYSNPTFVCVADLDADSGLASAGEYCGQIDSQPVQEELLTASGDESAAALVDTVVANASGEGPMNVFVEPQPEDLGEYQNRYEQADYFQYDPYGRWELSYSLGDSTWILIDYTGDSPLVSRLTPPAGAIMPVLDQRPPE